MPRLVYYWDSSVFLAYVNGESGRIEHVSAMLEEAEQGELEVLTSTLSIAEVVYGRLEQTGTDVEPSVASKIDELWTPSSPVGLVDVHPLIARQARDLMRESLSRGWSLKPYDSVHLATASSLSADEIHTYDSRWDRYAEDVGVVIREPMPAEPRLM